MNNGNWSEWIDWDGGDQPVPSGYTVQVRWSNGVTSDGKSKAYYFSWLHIGSNSDIVAYRYKIRTSDGISESDEEAAIQENYERLNNDSGSGQKFDGAKAMMDLIPPYIEEEVAMVLTFGARKYAPGNWRKVDNLRSRYLAASQRHINAIKKGENRDPESGLHHAAHAICCLMFLAEVELEQDDAL